MWFSLPYRRYGITAGSLDFVHDGLRLLFVEVANDDLCAFLSKEEGRTFTDSLRSA